MTTIIVVPCYNEESRLHLAAFRKFAKQSHALRFLFVNDGSTDGTAKMLDAFVAENPRDFSVIHMEKNVGKAEAVRQGMLYGLKSRPTKIGFWDADLATPLTAIDQFAEVIDAKPTVELVVGARISLLGHDIRRSPVRQFIGRAFARLASLMLGVPIYDTQCGAKMFRVTGRTRLFFERRFLAKWIFDVELLARMMHASGSRHGLCRLLYELPLDEWEDVAGSKLRPRHFLLAIVEMAQIYWRYLRPWAPRFLNSYRLLQVETSYRDEYLSEPLNIPDPGEQIEQPRRKAA